MKQAELAARNRSGGFWAATTDPVVVDHSVVERLPLDQVVHLAVVTDCSARITMSLGNLDWQQTAESADADGAR